MASIRRRGSNSYLIVVSRGYDYEGNRLKSVQKTVKPPKEYTPKQAEKWVKEQAILFEREVQHTSEPINRSITLAKYIEHWVADVGPKKLADSTYQRDLQDLNVHSLRHTNASLLIAQGVDVRTVASLLGHAQASTTLDIYAHAFDKNKRKAQEKLGKVIGL